MREEPTAFYEVYRLPWPLTGGEIDLVQEWMYHVDVAGRVLPGKWTEEQRAALQSLVDVRGPEARKPGHGNSLAIMSEEENRLSLALALTLLSPEQRQAYYAHKAQEERIKDVYHVRGVQYQPSFSHRAYL